MTSAFDHAMDDVLAHFDKQREDLVRLHRSMDEVSRTVRSRRRQVSATVDARGEIVELKFHGQSYKTMEPADLAKLIVDTIREARDEARGQMLASLADVDPESAEFMQVASTVDWSQQLAESFTLPPQLLSLLNTPPESLLDSKDFSELMTILSGGSNATAEKRVEGDDAASLGRGVPDERGA